MTTYFVCTTIRLASQGAARIILPGDVIDDARENVALLMARGALLVLTTDPFVAAAAAVCAALKKKGANELELEAVMRTGVDNSFHAGDNATLIQGVAVDPAAPATKNVLALVAGKWTPAAVDLAGGVASVTGTLPSANLAVATVGAPGAVQLAGDLGGSGTVPSVVAVHGATVPAGGALTTGNALQVTAAGALGYGPINLAGGANFVTGVLPSSNVASTGVTGLDTSLMSTGQFAWLTSTGQACSTDNSTAQGSASVGCYAGIAGQLAGPGAFIASAQFTTDGGKPYVGQEVWLANALDDAGAGAGKLTARQPSRAGQVGMAQQSTRFTYPRNPVRVFRVTDVSGYVGTKTCKGVVLAARVDADPPLPPINWAAVGLTGFSPANFISMPWNCVGSSFAEGDVKIIDWNIAGPALNPTQVLWQNQDGWTNGWTIVYSTASVAISITLWTGGVYTQINLPFTGRHGINRIVTGVRNGVLFGILNDGAMVSTPVTTAANVTSACLHQIGLGPFSVYAPTGSFLHCAHLHTAAAFSDAELSRWASSIVPPTPGLTNRLQLPEDVLLHPALVWFYDPTWNSLGPLMPGWQHASGYAFAMTFHGILTPVYLSEQYIPAQDLALLFQATGPVMVDSMGVPRANSSAQIKFSVAAGTQDLGIDVWSDSVDDGDQARSSVWIDGAYAAELVGPGQGILVAHGLARRFWIGLGPGGFVDYGSHTVEIRTNTSGEVRDTPFGPHGVFVTGIVVPSQQTFSSPVAATKCLLVIADNGLDGENVDTGYEARDSVVSHLRADYPTAGVGVTSLDTCGESMAAGFRWPPPSGSYAPYAQRLVDAATHEGQTTVSLVIYVDGYWEYNSPNIGGPTYSPATFGTDMGALVDAINAAFTAAGLTYAIFLCTTYRVHWNAIAVAGNTLSQFTSQIAALSSKPNTHVIDPTGGAGEPGVIADHVWLTAAGATAVKGYIKAAIQAVGASWY